MSKKLKKSLRFLFPFVWMSFIFYLSSRQKIAVSSSYWFSFFVFKSLHLIEYGVLFLLWYFALSNQKKKLKLAIAFSLLYAIFDEFHQTLIPSRQGKVRDVFIDFLGIIIFWRFFLTKIEVAVKSQVWLKKGGEKK
ncbi:VanZ family protein [Candidatus Shapirobacteria bacterium]|nr:VanZ family protein [Candidatus Shapirobacteria bacterium]